MLQCLRQFMVLALIALQFAAPLVHAHIGVETSQQFGLHMHEFEVFADAFKHVQTMENQAVSNEQLVIDLDAAIKPFQHAQDFQAVVGGSYGLSSLIGERQPQIRQFPLSAFTIPATPPLEQRSPRAPPV